MLQDLVSVLYLGSLFDVKPHSELDATELLEN